MKPEVDMDAVSTFGRGLNSFRVRFTLMVGVFCSLVAGLVFFWPEGKQGLLAHNIGVSGGIALALAIMGAAAVTYVMTGKLTRPIENLKASTEAIARGDYETSVSVDCQCEIGGLADSFQMMVSRLNANVSKINTLAYQDGVTGLPNRAVLDEIMKNIANMTGYLLFIDLDRFKQVNDVYGHQVGDMLLRRSAERMIVDGLQLTQDNHAQCLAPSRINQPKSGCRLLFRFAGDEFVALATGAVSETEIKALADRLIETLNTPFELEDRTIQIGASIGIAAIGRDGTEPVELINHADLAMYEAKKNGRGSFAFFDDEMRRCVLDRATLEADFSHAIQNGEIIVHYQPKVSLRDGTIDSLEALVRWQHPTRGLLYPASFLPIVESTGSLDVIGREVMAIAARDVARWRAAGRTLRVAINVCPTQFADDAFAENLTKYVGMLQASPHDFELEITENIAMADVVKARQHLHALKSVGFQIAIDDFGTGYSNLAQLSKMPFDCLKIDRSLIQDIATNHYTRTIISAVIVMARSLGHVVVAEGVEEQDQLDALKILGCDYVQGYFTGRPVPASELFNGDLETARLAS